MSTTVRILLATILLFAFGACSPEEQSPSSLDEGDDAILFRGDEDDDDTEHGQIPFADLEVFFEFNSTDDDLGFQTFLDAEGWKRVRAIDPHRQQVLDIRARGRLRHLGITELFFESAEPSPAEVLALFPPGEYRFGGRTVEGDRLYGVAELSHELPPPPVFTPTGGELVDPSDIVIEWNEIGGLDGFQLIVANEESGATLEVDLPDDVTSMRLPDAFVTADTEYKVEVLAISENGNKTITEGFFRTLP